MGPKASPLVMSSVRAACGGAHAGLFARVKRFQGRETQSLKDGSVSFPLRHENCGKSHFMLPGFRSSRAH